MQAKKQRTCGDGATERTASVYKKRRRLNCWHIRCAEARTVYEFTNHFLFMHCTGEGAAPPCRRAIAIQGERCSALG
jgi:hypothetical protein